MLGQLPLLSSLQNIKRKLYLTSIPVGCIVAIIVWFLEREQGVLHVFDRIGLPILVITYTILWFLLYTRTLSLLILEFILFTSFSLFMLVSMSFTLFIDHPVGAEVGDMAGAGYWFPVTYGLAFVIFGAQLGRKLAFTLFTASFVMGLIYLVSITPEMARREILVMSQIYTANALVLLLFISVATMTRMQTRYASNMERIANTDPLTGLGNRRRLEALLNHEVTRTERYDRIFCIILFDIDHFKKINDLHGHDIGDTVLKNIGNLFSSHVRAVDTIGRWGGEEFLIVTPELELTEACALAERLLMTLRTYHFSQVGSVTASFGVTQFCDTDTMLSLYKRADDAMYKAKTTGRNKVVSIAA